MQFCLDPKKYKISRQIDSRYFIEAEFWETLLFKNTSQGCSNKTPPLIATFLFKKLLFVLATNDALGNWYLNLQGYPH